MSEENVEIVREALEALLEGDEVAIGRLVDPELEFHGTVGGLQEGEVARGRAEIERVFENEDLAAWYPDAFDAESRRMIQERIRHRIDVDREEAMRFACNAVVLGTDVVLPEGCPKFRADLESLGLASHELPMSEFIKAGGACKCLVLQLSR